MEKCTGTGHNAASAIVYYRQTAADLIDGALTTVTNCSTLLGQSSHFVIIVTVSYTHLTLPTIYSV